LHGTNNFGEKEARAIYKCATFLMCTGKNLESSRDLSNLHIHIDF
jgi:hypothetical protein